MRALETTKKFDREFARVAGGNAALQQELRDVIQLLVADQPLPAARRDHKLKGVWKDHRDCHVRPDLVLIYAKPKGVLRLVRLGSHSELF